MSLEFRDVRFGPLSGLNAAAPAHAVIGLIGEKGCGITEFLRLAAGLEAPESGEVSGPAERRYAGPQDPVSPAPVDLLALDHSLGKYDAVVRARTCVSLDQLRRAGATVLLASHQEDLLEHLCDEVWWLHDGRIASKGAPAETLKRYRNHVASRIEAWGATLKPRLETSGRFGTGDAEIESIELLNGHGTPATTWKSGAETAARITLRFREAVANPVIGILIRNRIGLEVYGVNSSIDGLHIGPCSAGQTLRIVFHLRCELGAGSYTLTAAAQDPNGGVYDWLDDALAFVVVDDRPASGIANLHARVSVEA
jgi:lipopolysaccharide transport system ATP-binding protein